MAKQKNDYFKMIEEQVGFCTTAAAFIIEMFEDLSAVSIVDRREQMHKIENDADELHHKILNNLSTEFITPIDQEDILGLAQIIDDVTDSLDEIVLECFMFHVEELPDGLKKFARIVDRCVNALYSAAKELRNFKNPTKLKDAIVEVNTIESEADALYVEAIHNLFGNENDVKRLMTSKAIYDCLERCCDLCEHAADVIDRVIIKNT